MNITDAIARQARERPDAPALIREENRLTFAELDAGIDAFAARLAAEGLAPGQLVGVAMRTAPIKLIALLALARLGAVSIAIAPGPGAAARQALARRYGVAVLLAARKEHGVKGVPLALVGSGWTRRAKGADRAAASAPYDAPWRIALSSGTTGTPKGILWTHAQTLNYLLLYQTVAPAGPQTRYFCLRDLDAGIGLRECLRHLVAGGAVVFGRTTAAEEFVETANRQGVTHAMISPGILQGIVARITATRAVCPKLVHLGVAGSRLPPPLVAQGRARLTPNVYGVYGASEGGLVALADPKLLASDPECSGRIVPWVEAQAVDERHRPLPDGGEGVLRFRGPTFATGFHLDPEASAQAFRDGWFYPGDAGRISGGLLYVQSRIDDLINASGIKVSPAEIERVLEAHPDVLEAAAFGARPEAGLERIYAAVVTRRPVEERALIEHCRVPLGRRAPARIFAVRRLPRSEAGKLLRQELARRVASKPRSG
ncbi:MAG: hypothetical protein A3D95_13695 [Betaproteobacteria bacterium RIFCSPHIGHO2_12_FULL_69_13]|nr:MAG: hypothetical protein A3D95_13695 [Betaproteobacteria bacterium RIFCSPHIGHO2_12_FULL_69_13]OGA68492.1 MAG: hypothetical protein A3G83_03560 [Betaproteobacteria bacterium RIFCSPLOWO2_12_FULL_68_20]